MFGCSKEEQELLREAAYEGAYVLYIVIIRDDI